MIPPIYVKIKEFYDNVLKEVEVTDSFLGLDKYKTECQDEEPFDNCTTRQYKDSLLRNCDCVPFAIRVSNQVVCLMLKLIK